MVFECSCRSEEMSKNVVSNLRNWSSFLCPKLLLTPLERNCRPSARLCNRITLARSISSCCTANRTSLSTNEFGLSLTNAHLQQLSSVFSSPKVKQRSRSFHSADTCHSKSAPKHSKRKRPDSFTESRKLDLASKRSKIPFGELSTSELEAIFGHDQVKQDDGNRVLRTLHLRRMTGALADQGITVDKIAISKDDLKKALDWLRRHHPLDERAAAADWASKELERLGASYIGRAERLGLVERAEPSRDDSHELGGSRTSVIDQIREYNRQKLEREAKERRKSGEEQRSKERRVALVAEEQRQQEIKGRRSLRIKETGGIVGLILVISPTGTQQRAERHRYWQEQGMINDSTEPPNMTLLRRLGPSTAAGIFFLASCVAFASYYTPPAESTRIFGELPVSVATIGGIALTCFTVFFLWHVPPLWLLLNHYMMLVPGQPMAFSVLGNTFSHRQAQHLLINMLTLFVYGISLHEYLGRGDFLALYVAGGVMGSMTSLYWFVLRGILITSHNGASGSLFAVMAAWAYMNATSKESSGPEQEWASAWNFVRYGIILSLIPPQFMRSSWMRIDVISHLGGAITGLVGAYMMKKRQKGKTQYHTREGIYGNLNT